MNREHEQVHRKLAYMTQNLIVCLAHLWHCGLTGAGRFGADATADSCDRRSHRRGWALRSI